MDNFHLKLTLSLILLFLFFDIYFCHYGSNRVINSKYVRKLPSGNAQPRPSAKPNLQSTTKRTQSTTKWTESSKVITNSDDDEEYELVSTEAPKKSTIRPGNEEKIHIEIDLEGNHCMQEKNECVCVPWYQCSTEGTIITDGEGLIDERRKGNQSDSLCGDKLQACCSLDSTPSRIISDSYISEGYISDSEAPNRQITDCGQRNSCGIDRRLLVPKNKDESDFGEWPWQTLILIREEDEEESLLVERSGTKGTKETTMPNYKFQCAGALVGKRWILTIAHCLDKINENDMERLIVRLGEWDVRNDDAHSEFLPHWDVSVTHVYIHPNFNRKNLYHDIAVLELERDIEKYQPHIAPVCLPPNDEDEDDQLKKNGNDDEYCVVTGWGKKPHGKSTYSPILKEIMLSVVPHEKCQSLLRHTRLGPFFNLHHGFICAGGEEGIDVCTGDGGGPLSCYKSGKWRLKGLVSWGIGCGQKNVPGVYVNIQHYMSWIEGIINK